MKTLRFPILQRLRDYISLLPEVLGKQAEERDHNWIPLLCGINARVLVSWEKTTTNAYRVFFRHSFSGHARIELLLCHRMADGSVRMLNNVFGSGFTNSSLSDPRNSLRADSGSSISIVSMTVRYSIYDVSHVLQIDAADGTQQLYRQGKLVTDGPIFSLALHSLPLLQPLSAPITTPTTGNQELFAFALANC